MSIKFLLAHGSRDTKINTPDQSYEGITWAEISKMVKEPQCVEKENAAFIIPSEYREHDGRSHEVQREKGIYHALVLDIDDGNHELKEVQGAVQNALGDFTHIIYSSSGASDEHKKWRVFVPLDTPIEGAEYSDAQFALFEEMEKQGITPDAALARTGQPVYLPNVPSQRRDDDGNPLFYQSHVHKAQRFDYHGSNMQQLVQHRIEERKKSDAIARAEMEKRKAERLSKAELSGEESPIDAFNERHSVEDLAEQYGYRRLGHSKQWRSPNQTTKSYAVKIEADYWVSQSGSDVAAGVGTQKSHYCWGDAFSLYVHYEHQGDFTAAVRAYGGELHAQKLGAKPRPASDFGFEIIPDGFDVNAVEVKEVRKSIPEEAAVGEVTPNFVMDHKGRVPLNHHNTREIFRTHSDWRGVLAFDEFAQRKMLLKRVPMTAGNPNLFRPREIRDDDYIDIISWFNSNGFPNASKNTVIDCADKACMENIISPVKHWLESLEVEDEDDDLLDQWAFKYLDIKADDPLEAEYVRQVTSKWLISAVARALNAGCKADAVLILEGTQGAGKSTAIRLLCGDDWFGDALPPMHTKDASDYVRGKWIVELAELSNVNKAEVEIVKAFVSRSEERFRPAYGRSEITYPRHCVFAGTTNKSDYLRDETGNRRFWPVKVGAKIDTQGIKKAREQIWAHAVMAYKNGEQWWLDDYADKLARSQQDKRLASDEWMGRIETYLEGKDAVSITQVAADALQIEVKSIGRAEQNRITSILATLGYERDGKFTSGERRNQSRFSRERADHGTE